MRGRSTERNSSVGPSEQVVGELRNLLEHAWSADTSADPKNWSKRNPSWGQCAVTALLVQDLFGGKLLRAELAGVSHYWNLLTTGEEIDLTRDQFGDAFTEGTRTARERSYVMAFPETRRRYELIRSRLAPRLPALRT